jgi:hypothetical protein
LPGIFVQSQQLRNGGSSNDRMNVAVNCGNFWEKTVKQNAARLLSYLPDGMTAFAFRVEQGVGS